MLKPRREYQFLGLIFISEQRNDFIFPHLLESVVGPVGVLDPSIMGWGKSSRSGGQVDGEGSFEISAEGMYGQVNAGNEAVFFGERFYDMSGQRGDGVAEMSIGPKESPQDRWHRKGDMLPGCIREGVEGVFNPGIGGLFPARGTNPRFTGVRDFDLFFALSPGKQVISQKGGSANENL